MDSQRIYKRITAAQVLEVIPAPGNKVFVQSCSAPFGLKCGNRNESVANVGDLYDYGDTSFTHVTVRNLIATAGVTLTVTLRVGTAYVTFNVPPIPNTSALGWINFPSGGASLADAGTEIFPGIASDVAAYANAGVSAGSRRKYMTVSLKPSLSGTIRVFNNVTGGLLAIVAASSSGGGFPIETDCDIKIENNTGSPVQMTGATPDIAIAETFYV